MPESVTASASSVGRQACLELPSACLSRLCRTIANSQLSRMPPLATAPIPESDLTALCRAARSCRTVPS